MLTQVLVLLLYASTSFAVTDTLPQRMSISVEKPSDNLVSADGDFSAGFFQVGYNAFCFSVWFTRSKEPTAVWMANRDKPVNGKGSKLSLLETGNLVLVDSGSTTSWTNNTLSRVKVQLKLMNNGNLVLCTFQGTILWQSFDSPTDTLLPGQPLTGQATLVSSRSKTDYSSGFYKLYFDSENVLRLLYKGPSASGLYWPDPTLSPFDASVGRSTFNISKTALLDSYGSFTSSDGFKSNSSDYGWGPHRRLVIDSDGNLRIYSFNEDHKMWEVSWQVFSQPCVVNGLCGDNGICTYDPLHGRTCYCLQGYKVKNPNDWTEGCEPNFNPADLHRNESTDFLYLPNLDFAGFQSQSFLVSNLAQCLNSCMTYRENCKGIQLLILGNVFSCYLKTTLLYGRDSPSVVEYMYLKLPKASIHSSKKPHKHSPLKCSVSVPQIVYQKRRRNPILNFFVWFACGVGVLEMSTIFLVWFFLFRTNKQRDTGDEQRHLLSATRFQRFTYAELKRATKGFSEEIGRGAGGIVYKGALDDDRVAAIKYLSEANQGEAEFLAEIKTIGMLNHMNLIEMWGYCVEGKHRLLVYEYMEHGSLADNLSSRTLDWKKRFNIALGTAKGLAYLHEECLEWVLHCDVKPQNILLDSDFQPKVADFGLSKLLKRDDERDNSGFSRIRGTRGYMAPEWVYNLRITSKVDVYSYGIVVLEMVTGKSALEIHDYFSSSGIEQRRLVTWVKEIINNAPTSEFWVEEIADPKLEGQYDISQVEILVKVALQCVQENMNERPSMSRVVEMLQSH